MTAAGGFCESCGKALPSMSSSGPRVVTGDVVPTSVAGQKLVGAELKKQTNRAAYTLLAIGIIQIVLGSIFIGIAANAPGAPAGTFTTLMIMQFIVAAVFIGLFFWARIAPLGASIVGLVLYSTLIILNMINAMAIRAEGQRSGGFGGLGIGCLDIVFIAFLVQGIQAGLKHKRMLEAGAA
jgi:hypothetical protein